MWRLVQLACNGIDTLKYKHLRHYDIHHISQQALTMSHTKSFAVQIASYFLHAAVLVEPYSIKCQNCALFHKSIKFGSCTWRKWYEKQIWICRGIGSCYGYGVWVQQILYD